MQTIGDLMQKYEFCREQLEAFKECGEDVEARMSEFDRIKDMPINSPLGRIYADVIKVGLDDSYTSWGDMIQTMSELGASQK